MNRVATFQAIIAVGEVENFAQVISAPKDAIVGMDGSFCEDNSFKDVPEDIGVYLCDVDFYFEQGYCDGYKADGESDWEYRVVKATPLISLPDVSETWKVIQSFGDQKMNQTFDEWWELFCSGLVEQSGKEHIPNGLNKEDFRKDYDKGMSPYECAWQELDDLSR